jgi:hypothetical protein
MNSGPNDLPSFPPPPPPSAHFFVGSAAPRESVGVGLAKWTYGLMIATGIAAAVRGVLALAVNQSMNEFLDTFSDRAASDFVDRANAYDTVDSVYAVATLATFVLLIVFSFRAYKASQTIWAGPRKWSRGWTVGGWFIPFANAYIPASVLIETEKISRAPRMNGNATEGWRQLNRDNGFVLWFVLYLVGLVVASRISSLDASVDDLQDISDRLVVGAIGNGIICAGCIVGAVTLKKMAARLSPAAIG